jgi:hypothetical protein
VGNICGGFTLTAVFSNGTGTVDHGIGPVTSGLKVSTGPIGVATRYTLTVVDPFGDTATAQVTVGAPCYTFPAETEPCTPTKDVSGGQSGTFGTTGSFCFRTADDFTDYGCSSADGRTLKINGTEATTCGGKPPAKAGSFCYFDFGPGKYDYASVNWYCSTQSCLGPYPVPSCGHYPPWQSGATVVPCSDSTTSTAADVVGTAVDSSR